jgi:hypothetical protein
MSVGHYFAEPLHSIFPEKFSASLPATIGAIAFKIVSIRMAHSNFSKRRNSQGGVDSSIIAYARRRLSVS